MFTNKVKFLVIYLIRITIFARDDITFKNIETETNRSCIIKNSGLLGICVPFSECKNAQMTFRNHKINPTNCYFNNLEPVVCCSDIFEDDWDHPKCRKSEIQCGKYDDDGTINPNPSCFEIECKKNVSNFDFDLSKCRYYSASNGVETRIGDFSFMAAIGFQQYDGKILFNCGGFLVTRSFVITAAHCTDLGGDPPVVVRTGGIDLDNNTNINLDIPISTIFIHPLYNKKQAYNDIALIKLTKPSNDVSKCLSETAFIDYTGLAVISVGYGQISFGGPGSNNLLQVNLTIVSNEECNKYYPKNDYLPQGIQPSQVCAMDYKKELTQDTCQGDSGGPLLTFFNNIPALYGITSFGNICGSKTPGVYTRVEYYFDWIESIIWPNV